METLGATHQFCGAVKKVLVDICRRHPTFRCLAPMELAVTRSWLQSDAATGKSMVRRSPSESTASCGEQVSSLTSAWAGWQKPGAPASDGLRTTVARALPGNPVPGAADDPLHGLPLRGWASLGGRASACAAVALRARTPPRRSSAVFERRVGSHAGLAREIQNAVQT